MKELRVQFAGKPYRICFAFDPRQTGILLIGGIKSGRGWTPKMFAAAPMREVNGCRFRSLASAANLGRYPVFVSSWSCSAQVFGAESVRDELIRRQQDTGLAFVWLDREGFAKAIDFATGLFTSQKNISRPEFAPADFDLGMFGPWRVDYCWSHDRQNIFGVQSTADNRALVVVNRRSKEVRTVACELPYPHVAPHCWSRDDRQLVSTKWLAKSIFSIPRVAPRIC